MIFTASDEELGRGARALLPDGTDVFEKHWCKWIDIDRCEVGVYVQDDGEPVRTFGRSTGACLSVEAKMRTLNFPGLKLFPSPWSGRVEEDRPE